jgi:hypothetical protein
MSCEKDKDLEGAGSGKLVFAVNSVAKKSSSTQSLQISKIDYALVSITKAGEIYKDFNQKKIKINKWDKASFTTEDIELETGNDYKLTLFTLKAKDGESLFASPTKNSNLEKQVNSPLPIDFSISADNPTGIMVEVLKVEGKSPSDFGYAFITVDFPRDHKKLVRKQKMFNGKEAVSLIYEYFYKNEKLDYYTLNVTNKFMCKYNEKGQLVEEYLNSNSKNLYTYNELGQKTEFKKGVQKNGSFYGRFTYKYENGKLKIEEYYNKENKLITRTYYTKIFWRENSDYKIILKNNSEGKMVEHAKVFITKDEQGRVMEEAKYLEGSDSYFSKTFYTYK